MWVIHNDQTNSDIQAIKVISSKVQSNDDSVWSDLCTWLWESELKLMEVPWAGFFSSLGGNEQHNIRSDGTNALWES